MPPTPRGTVSCLFTDIEGSTRLLKALGERYAEVLQRHRALLRGAFAEHGGYEVDTQGDAFFVAFERATAAVAAAASAQRALAAEAWPGGEPLRVRMGIHTGEAVAEEEGYVGLDVHRGARICGAAHGGQVLLSATARELVEGALPADLSLRDLGDHALKDLSGRQRLFQLVLAGLPSDFPPPRAMDARRTNLPAQATSFVGRRREVEQVSALVLDRSVRVLTLMGPGGAGKTRLALQAAAGCLDDVQGGVFVAFLAALRDVDLVLPAIAHAFGLVLRPDREPVETIAEAIGDEPMLIVVDNIEHLLDAVPLLGALVEAAPGLTLLVTSRERLRLAGEHCYVVPPLGLPTDGGASPAAILASDAVSLLVERACAVDAGFRVEAEDLIDVAEVCRRLDGLPLALELAAARLPMLGPAALRRRLDRRLDMLKGGSRDVDHRQRALRATIDWSYDLLEHEERIVLARLGVFVGSFGLEAAERVAGDDVLEVVGSLVDKSLLRAARDGEGEPTFRMLETIREYALERLGEGEEARAAARRHAEHALALAETAAPALEGADQPRWLDRLESAYPDVRAAIVWSIEHDVGLALRIASALHLFWSVRGYLADGRTLLQEALSRASDADPLLRADALVASAYLGFFLGDSGGALVEAEQAVGLIGAGEDRHRGRALRTLGIATEGHDLEAARALYLRAGEVSRRAGDDFNLAIVCNNVGNVELELGDLDAAHGHLEQGLAIRRRTGELRGVAITLQSLGYLALQRAELQVAAARLHESLRVAQGIHFTELIGVDLDGFGVIAGRADEPAAAARLFGAAAVILEGVGASLWGVEKQLHAQVESVLRSRLGEDHFARQLAGGRGLDIDQAIAYARSVVPDPASAEGAGSASGRSLPDPLDQLP